MLLSVKSRNKTNKQTRNPVDQKFLENYPFVVNCSFAHCALKCLRAVGNWMHCCHCRFLRSTVDNGTEERIVQEVCVNQCDDVKYDWCQWNWLLNLFLWNSVIQAAEMGIEHLPLCSKRWLQTQNVLERVVLGGRSRWRFRCFFAPAVLLERDRFEEVKLAFSLNLNVLTVVSPSVF